MKTEPWRYYVRRFDGVFWLWKFVGESPHQADKDAEEWRCDNPAEWRLICSVRVPADFRRVRLLDEAIRFASMDAAATIPFPAGRKAYPIRPLDNPPPHG